MFFWVKCRVNGKFPHCVLYTISIVGLSSKNGGKEIKSIKSNKGTNDGRDNDNSDIYVLKWFSKNLRNTSVIFKDSDIFL